MAGGAIKYRHLSRNSSQRQALLRGLVTSLIQHEHIHTTYGKACEAQPLADKLITIAKKGGENAEKLAMAELYEPHLNMPKLFGELRERYLNRDGGYTRVLRTEPKDDYDKAPSAILEFVDGPRDSRFMLTAKTVARDRLFGREHSSLTSLNIDKVTRYRTDKDFEDMVKRYMIKGMQGFRADRAAWNDTDPNDQGSS